MDRRALLVAPLALAPLALAATSVSAEAPSGDAAGAGGYVRYPTVTATILRPDGRRGMMTVETGIDAPDAALKLRAEQSQPRMRAVFNILVQREANGLLPGRVPNVERLGAQLQSATNIILGQRGAKLLLGTVMVV